MTFTQMTHERTKYLKNDPVDLLMLVHVNLQCLEFSDDYFVMKCSNLFFWPKRFPSYA